MLLVFCFPPYLKLVYIDFFLETEKEIHAVIPLTEQATEVYRQICLNGLNRKGVSVTFKYLTEKEFDRWRNICSYCCFFFL